MSYYLQEDAVSRFLLEDGSGLLLLEADPALNADLSQTLGALSLTSAGTVIVAANLASTLGLASLSSAGAVIVVANLSDTLGLASLSSAGAVRVAGNLSDTLGLLGLSSAGAAIVAASLSQTLGLLSLSSDGTVVSGGGTVNADLSVTLGDLLLSADASALEHEPGGISGYLKPKKMYQGANLMLEPMADATARAERIMAGWKDDEEAMLLIQIIQTFYD